MPAITYPSPTIIPNPQVQGITPIAVAANGSASMVIGSYAITGLQAWYNIDTVQSVAPGAAVGTILDQTGLGSRDLTAVGAPTYVVNSINGRPGVSCVPATPTYHRNSSVNLASSGGARTVFFVGKSRSTTGGAFFQFRIGATGQFFFEDLHTGGSHFWQGSDTSHQNGLEPGTAISGVPHIWEVSYSGRGGAADVASADTAIRAMMDGVPQPITANALPTAESGTTGFVLGSREDATTLGWDGEWSQCVVFNRDLSAYERTLLRAALARSYSLTARYPISIQWLGDSHLYGVGSAATLLAGGPRQALHALHTGFISQGSQYAPPLADGIYTYNDGYTGATSGTAVGSSGTFIGGSHLVGIMGATKPDITFLMIGTNDPIADTITASQTATNVLQIVSYINAVSPQTRVIVCRAPLLPTSNGSAAAANPVITAQGPAMQAALTATAAPNVAVSPTLGNVCILPTLADSFYVDSIHLNTAGWTQMITQAINPFLTSLGLP